MLTIKSLVPSFYCFILVCNVCATPLPNHVSVDQQDNSVKVSQLSGEHEAAVREKRDENDQIGPFPMLGGPDKAGKVFTVTGKRETQSDNVLVNPNRLSLSFIDIQPKLKRRTLETDEIDGGQPGVMSDASPQHDLNPLPLSAESTSIDLVEIDKKSVLLENTEEKLSSLITDESNPHSIKDSSQYYSFESFSQTQHI